MPTVFSLWQEAQVALALLRFLKGLSILALAALLSSDACAVDGNPVAITKTTIAITENNIFTVVDLIVVSCNTVLTRTLEFL